MEKAQQQQKGEEDPSSNGSNKKQETLVCQECKQNPSKYKCPGCSLRTCSLTCVKAHKQRTACTGKRNQTQFVPLSQFDDNLLLSDYNLLEEMKRVSESAQRKRAKLGAYPSYRLPFHLQSLRRAAMSRRIKLFLLPSGMLKREKNQTQYDQKKKFISWTIEWRFHSTDVVLHDHRVHEDTKLCSVLEKHLKPGPWNHQLRPFCEDDVDALKLFIRKDAKGPKSPFCKLDVKASLRQQLADVVIMEYPVIHVFLSSHSYNFKIIKDMHPVTHRRNANIAFSNDHPSPKGVIFREEEIEDNADNGSSDPQVCDFIKKEIVGPQLQLPHHSPSDRALDCSFDVALVARETAVDVLHSSLKSEKPVVFENMDFDFDQGLIDAYSDLIAQINPDDFLDLDGGLCKEEDRNDLSGSRGFFSMEEELEEGEIPE